MTALPRPCICLVTDRRQVAPRALTLTDECNALEAFLVTAIDAAVDVIQIRERDVDARALAPLIARVLARARPSGTRVLVNDRADLALAAGADGVHLPAAGLPASRVRALAPAWIIGRSVHAGDFNLASAGCDYLLFGTVFASTSKPAGWRVAGVDALRDVVEAARVPVLAIGGVTPAHAFSVAAAGAAGVAAVSLFLPPPAGLGPAAAVRALRGAFAPPS